MNNEPPTQQAAAAQALASGLMACSSSGSSGTRSSGAVVALRCLRFRIERRSQSRSGRRVAMPEELRRQHRVVVVTTSYKVHALMTAPAAPTTPPTNRAPHIQTATTRTRARTGAAAPTLSQWVAPRPFHGHSTAISRPPHDTKHAHARTSNAGRS
jgi:hypothetical protein